MPVYPRHGHTYKCRVLHVRCDDRRGFALTVAMFPPVNKPVNVEWADPPGMRCPRVGDVVEVIADVIMNRGRVSSWSLGFIKVLSQEEDEMAMSKDRVRFDLPSGYIMPRSDTGRRMTAVMVDSFGETCQFWSAAFAANPGGLTILCRPSQFARFMIYRNAADITNGFKELRPALLDEIPDPFDKIAERNDLSARQVRSIIRDAGFDPDDADIDGPDWIDVSKNPRQCV